MATTEHAPSSAAWRNQQFYSKMSAGSSDYWKKMAAPRFRRATIQQLLAQRPVGSVVDLGCGGGQLLAEIGQRHPQAPLTGLDLSQEQIEFNRQHFPQIGWQAIDLGRPDLLPDSLRGQFDTLIATELIEHVDDPLALLQTARLLARPGGRARLLLSTQSGPVRATEITVGHVQHFSAAQMQKLLVESGWCPEKVWNAGFPFHDLSKWWANRNPQKTLAQFGDRPYGWRENLVCLVLRWLFLFNSQRRGAQLFATALACA